MGAADLRYMQISITSSRAFTCLVWPSWIPSRVLNFSLTSAPRTMTMRCLIRLEHTDASALDGSYPSLDILRVIEQRPTASLVETLTSGPLPRSLCRPGARVVGLAHLPDKGRVRRHDSRHSARRSVEQGISSLLDGRYKMKLGPQSAHNAHFLELLPDKQRAVLDEAIKMGYYDRPRRCTQRHC